MNMNLWITLKSIYKKKVHDIHVFSYFVTFYHFNTASEVNVLSDELNVEVSEMLSKDTTSLKNIAKSN